MTRIQPFPAPFAEKARAALPRPAGTAVFVLTHEARSALCGRFGLEDSQLDRALGLLGAARVEDPDVPHGPIEADAAELLARLAEGRLPWFIHACPRWRRDVLRRYPQLSAFFSPARPAPCPARVAVVGCAARKAALAREGWTEALTVREAALRLIRGGFAHGARHAVCTRRPRMAGARLFAGGPSGGRGLQAPSVLCAGAPLRRRGNGPFLFAGPRCARRARTRSRSDGTLAGVLRSPCVALAGDRGPGVCRRMRSWVVTMRPSFLHMSVLRERMLKKDFR